MSVSVPEFLEKICVSFNEPSSGHSLPSLHCTASSIHMFCWFCIRRWFYRHPFFEIRALGMGVRCFSCHNRCCKYARHYCGALLDFCPYCHPFSNSSDYTDYCSHLRDYLSVICFGICSSFDYTILCSIKFF